MSKQNGAGKIQKLLDKYGDNVAILEEEIDIQLQRLYFKESKLQKKQLEKEQVLLQKEKLFSSEVSLEDKKVLLCQLASIDEVEAFRTLQRYKEHPDKPLAAWSVLACQESKMRLQSVFLEKKPLFISTGLGGRGKMLRYFIVIFTNKYVPFSAYQKELVSGEVDYVFKKERAELESIEFYESFVTIQALISLDTALKNMLSKIIVQCNEIGNFLSPSLLVTNVKKLSSAEIEKMIEQKYTNQNTNNDGIQTEDC
ncbi:hypothetical protein [Carboxylicivirga taeanensis]|uniref:hypothetical protein n=1 Tax=Carboxylicivirga taeanensis TaxID=1416875 RepID=UPI003F6E1326